MQNGESYDNYILICYLILILIIYLSASSKSKRGRVEPKSATLDYEPLISYAEEIGYSHKSKQKIILALLDRMNDNYKYILNTYRRLSDIVNKRARFWVRTNGCWIIYIIEQTKIQRNV